MSAASVLDWPTGARPTTRSFRLRPYNITSVASQTQELIPGGLIVQRYEAKLTLGTMEAPDWLELDGILSDLAGVGGKLRLWDHARKQPYYNRTATETESYWDNDATWEGGAGWASGLLPPLVVVAENAARGATSIKLREFPASLTAVLRRGDLIEFWPNGARADTGELHTVTGTANTNASGETRVYFRAGLRRGIKEGDIACIGAENGPYPSSVFRLSADDDGEISVDRAPDYASSGVTLVEVLPHT